MANIVLLMIALTFPVAAITASYVSDRERRKHREASSETERADRESCCRFSTALDAFEKDLGPVSFNLIDSDRIFMAWRRRDYGIDLSWRRGSQTPVEASLRVGQCAMDLVVDDLHHVLAVMRRWAAEHGMLRSQSTPAVDCAQTRE